jgi:uncharacterized protein YutE (UPF0331/DUF86 family)
VVRLEIVQRKLAELDDRVARVRAHRRASRDELASDRDALDLVAFNLMLAVQAACDLAAHLIADEGWTAPASVAECFHQLAEHQVISAATTRRDAASHRLPQQRRAWVRRDRHRCDPRRVDRGPRRPRSICPRSRHLAYPPAGIGAALDLDLLDQSVS